MTFEDEAMREWAFNVGRELKDEAWLLTNYDVWVKNPFYCGPAQPHPETRGDEDDLNDMIIDNDYFDDVGDF